MNQNRGPIAFTSPHYAASQVGYSILESGGTAIEAMIAGAASIAVEYPHMNGLGGDGFWLISEPGKTPICIDASGVAVANASLERYKGMQSIPSRGPDAALTMAGAVAGWQKAREISARWQPNIPLKELLSQAIGQARWGIEVTQSLQSASQKTFDDLHALQGFSQFCPADKPLSKGETLKLPALADTLDALSRDGLDSFYCGDVATALAKDLSAAGTPITLQDFQQYEAIQCDPLHSQISAGALYNFDAPTQGVASLLILSIYDRVRHLAKSETDQVHLLVEATKQAFIYRNTHVADRARLKSPLQDALDPVLVEQMAANVKLDSALPWPHAAKPGDTVWLGACDEQGRMVSYIQSLYWEFGSGIVSPQSGIVWNNRGTSFSLDPSDINALAPGHKPFHTLNPAFAQLKDGRRMVYGTMGGEGQPQTQAALFSRHVFHGHSLPSAIEKGRWLLGRTWGDQSHNLKIEADLADELAGALAERGHDIAVVDARNELMGHAGAIVLDGNEIDASSDPRSDGKALTGGVV